MRLLVRAAQIPDYAEHEKFLAALGFGFSSFRSRIVREQGVENPKVLGMRQDLDIRPDRKTTLSAAMKDVEYSGFVPEGANFSRVSLSFGLKTTSLCISRAGFEKAFSPIEHIYATDFGGEHPERTFSGKHIRHVAAFFDGKGCAIKIYFGQSS
ncbi:hypothetical protein [Massilia luteola]|uniref:hypothetical protein n=1 Tax=Massilia luteola TaxID=3081751 RepID=UPI002ACC0503|nr:hypothetical protein [Massilia sp. Gc5]